ncbi:glycosyltransferase family 2 protein [Bacteroides sp.]|uniref:glycosyltransferase family 2 protein n=1 Tax=Bacteroides sp. TaxID=29523 RepID=UPI0025BEB974|nr:glycosyltransferase family 2 protein [Bacteroides sp.]
MNNTPLLSFITVCYNGIADTCALIESIHKTIHSTSYEIIVVDNASREDETAIIKTHYPTVVTVRSHQNLGFSGGNNLGLKIARGRYLFIINNDTYFESDGIQALIDRLESDPLIGAVSPKIRFAFPPQHIQFAGYTQLGSITMRNEAIGMGHPDDGSFETPRLSPYLHGAAMLIKHEVIDRVGPMPEIYFLYYEELDWCTAMTRAGYTLWYEPRCTIFHKESQSTGQQSPLRTFYLTRNRLLYAWRNLTGMHCLLSIFYQITIAAAKNSLVHLFKHRTDLILAVWKGVFAFFSLPNKKNDTWIF